MAFTLGQVLTAAQLNDFAPGTRVQVPDGTAGAPSITNTGDTNTGLYFYEADGVAVTTGGNQRLAVDADGSTYVKGITATVASLNVVHADAAGDAAVYFGDATDGIQAGVYYDESAQTLELRSYNNSWTIKLDGNQAAFRAGTAGAPAITTDGDLDTGVHFPGADRMGFAAGSTQYVEVDANGMAMESGSFYVQDGTAAAPAIRFKSNASTGIYLVTTDQMGFACGGTESFRIVDAGTTQEIFPGADNTFLLGIASRRWEEIYCANSTINTSDITFKDRTGDVLGLDFVRRLEPFAGTWKPEHRSKRDPGRVHQWLAAQDVAEALTAEGVDPASTNLWRDTDGGQSLAYTELIPVLVRAVQELAERVDA